MSKFFKIFCIFLLSFNVLSLEVLEVKILDSYLITKEFPGKLVPLEQSKLAFQVPGKIQKINVDIGDEVAKGDVLAELDKREAISQLNQAKAKFDLSLQLLSRYEDLKKDGHISVQELDRVNSEYLIAKSQYELYKVKVEQTDLIAPFNGVIQSRFLDTGTVINAGAPILEILDSNYVEAHISVPIEFLENMKIGTSYGFEFDNKTANGTFARLAPMSPGGSDSRLAIFKFESFFNPGSTAKLKLSVNKKSEGTWVPLRSLSQSEQGIWAVYTINENEIVVRDFVDIIYFEDEYAFVNGTLQDGDLIVLGGASKIIEGKKVN